MFFLHTSADAARMVMSVTGKILSQAGMAEMHGTLLNIENEFQSAADGVRPITSFGLLSARSSQHWAFAQFETMSWTKGLQDLMSWGVSLGIHAFFESLD
jgi:hypothetical protein